MATCICESRSIRYTDRDGAIRTAPVTMHCAQHAPAAREAQRKHDAGVRREWFKLLRPACLQRLALPAPESETRPIAGTYPEGATFARIVARRLGMPAAVSKASDMANSMSTEFSRGMNDTLLALVQVL